MVSFLSLDADRHTISVLQESTGTNSKERHFTWVLQVRDRVLPRIERAVVSGQICSGTPLRIGVVQGWDDDHDCTYLTSFALYGNPPDQPPNAVPVY